MSEGTMLTTLPEPGPLESAPVEESVGTGGTGGPLAEGRGEGRGGARVIRRARRASGQFAPGDVVVVPSRRFLLAGVAASTARRIGRFVGVDAGAVLVYCPIGGFVSASASGVHRATAAQERAFRAKWDGLLGALRRGR